MKTQEKGDKTNNKPKARGVLVMLLLALTLGAVAAAVVWVFVFAMGLSYEYLWQVLPAAVALPLLPVLICAAGGLLIGVWEKFVSPPPLLLEDSLKIISKEKRFPYKGLPKTVVSSFLPLAFGGAVGPEAGLVNIIAGLCTWVGDKLKAAGVASAELAEAGLAATMTALFGAPIAGLVIPLEGRFEANRKDVEPVVVTASSPAASAAVPSESFGAKPAQAFAKTPSNNPVAKPAAAFTKTFSPLSRQNKLLFYLAAVAGGFAVMLTLSHFFGGGLGLPRFERAQWYPGEILWSIPLALVGVLGGYLFSAANLLTAQIARHFKHLVILRAVFCGLLIGLIGSFLPYALFSGEEQMGELTQGFASMGAWLLIATGVVKLCVCPLCVNMGWRGGNIFPVIFAGISLGYGIALATGLDPTFCITVLSSSLCAAVMRKPLLAIAVLLLCFPVADIIFMIIAALIGGALPLPKVFAKENAKA